MTATTAPAGVRVVSVDDVEALAPHAAAWDALVLEAPHRPHTVSHAYLASFFEHKLEPGQEPRCFLAYAGDRLVGVVPLVRRPHERLGPSHPRLKAPCSFQTDEGDLLLPSADRTVLGALLDAAVRREPGTISIEFGGIREGTPTLRAIARGAPRGRLVRGPDGHGRRVVLGRPYETIVAGVGANFRRNLRKARNRLERTAGVRFRFLEGAQADPALAEPFFALEASGWKGRARSAIACSPVSRGFYAAVARRAASRGWLEWHVLEIEGRPAAAHLGFRLGRTLSLHRIAYDEAFARLVPGHVLFDELLRRESERAAVDEINCMTDMPWHDHWAMDRYAYHRLLVFPAGALPLVLGWVPARLRRAVADHPWVARRRASRKAGAAPAEDDGGP